MNHAAKAMQFPYHNTRAIFVLTHAQLAFTLRVMLVLTRCVFPLTAPLRGSRWMICLYTHFWKIPHNLCLSPGPVQSLLLYLLVNRVPSPVASVLTPALAPLRWPLLQLTLWLLNLMTLYPPIPTPHPSPLARPLDRIVMMIHPHHRTPHLVFRSLRPLIHLPPVTPWLLGQKQGFLSLVIRLIWHIHRTTGCTLHCLPRLIHLLIMMLFEILSGWPPCAPKCMLFLVMPLGLWFHVPPTLMLLGVGGYFAPSTLLMALLIDTKLGLLLRDSVRFPGWIVLIHLARWWKRPPFASSWLLRLLINGSYIS